MPAPHRRLSVPVRICRAVPCRRPWRRRGGIRSGAAREDVPDGCPGKRDLPFIRYLGREPGHYALLFRKGTRFFIRPFRTFRTERRLYFSIPETCNRKFFPIFAGRKPHPAGSRRAASRLPRLRRLKRNTEQNMSIRKRLQTLSFRTGVIILLMCVPFYVLSFSQMLLPLPVATKGILWAVLFGLAKAFQYSGIAILGVEGYKRVKGWFRRRESAPGGTDAAAVRQTPARCRPDLFSDPSLLEGIRLVIFDFDGTLGDSRRLITDTMLATIGRLGLPRRSREECARTIGLPLKECFSSMIPMDEAQAEQCAATYTEIFNVKNVPGAVTAFPGVEETLGRLSERGIAMSIASSRSHRSLAGLVHDLHLSDYISYLIGADDTAHQKPAADPVVLTLHHFGVRADEALVVGDTEFDILMGRNAGTHTCGVTYGNGSRESLEAAGAERIIC